MTERPASPVSSLVSRPVAGPVAGPPNSAAPLDLNLLRTFLAVHRSGSFTSAAHQLGLSQSTVTTQIRALETRLERDLFERRARGVAALPYADEFAARLAVPLDQLSDLADLGGGPARAAAPVHLAGPAEFLGTSGLRALASLVADGVQLRISTGLAETLLDELRAGRHDLVVATRRPRSRVLVAEPFADEEFILVAAPEWAERLSAAGLVEAGLPDRLAAAPLISYDADLPIVRRYWRHVFDQRLAVQAAVTVPDLRAVLTAVLAGAGWSVLPGYLCRNDLLAGRLVILHRPADPPINTAFLVQRPGSLGNPHVALVRERLLATAREWLHAEECGIPGE